MIDFNHGSDNREAVTISDRVNYFIDNALIEKEASKEKRRYLGASELGDPCSRRIQLNYLASIDDPNINTYVRPISDGRLLRIFNIGHAFEEVVAEWFISAGFKLDRERNGKQHGFETADGRIGGHIDGVLKDGPPFIKYPALWEHKAINTKSWGEIADKGVRVARPRYAAQVAMYQAYMDLDNPALFTALNKNTQELYHELIPLDADLAQKISDKGVAILKAVDSGMLMPPVAHSEDYYECRGCRWWSFCWGKG